MLYLIKNSIVFCAVTKLTSENGGRIFLILSTICHSLMKENNFFLHIMYYIARASLVTWLFSTFVIVTPLGNKIFWSFSVKPKKSIFQAKYNKKES